MYSDDLRKRVANATEDIGIWFAIKLMKDEGVTLHNIWDFFSDGVERTPTYNRQPLTALNIKYLSDLLSIPEYPNTLSDMFDLLNKWSNIYPSTGNRYTNSNRLPFKEVAEQILNVWLNIQKVKGLSIQENEFINILTKYEELLIIYKINSYPHHEIWWSKCILKIIEIDTKTYYPIILSGLASGFSLLRSNELKNVRSVLAEEYPQIYKNAMISSLRVAANKNQIDDMTSLFLNEAFTPSPQNIEDLINIFHETPEFGIGQNKDVSRNLLMHIKYINNTPYASNEEQYIDSILKSLSYSPHLINYAQPKHYNLFVDSAITTKQQQDAYDFGLSLAKDGVKTELPHNIQKEQKALSLFDWRLPRNYNKNGLTQISEALEFCSKNPSTSYSIFMMATIILFYWDTDSKEEYSNAKNIIRKKLGRDPSTKTGRDAIIKTYTPQLQEWLTIMYSLDMTGIKTNTALSFLPDALSGVINEFKIEDMEILS